MQWRRHQEALAGASQSHGGAAERRDGHRVHCAGRPSIASPLRFSPLRDKAKDNKIAELSAEICDLKQHNTKVSVDKVLA